MLNYSNEDVSKVDIKEDNETSEEMQPTPEPEDMCRAVNHKLNKIHSLKRQNQIREQQEFVSELKEKYGSYRDLKKISGTPLKTLHGWCAFQKTENTEVLLRQI